jgi:hypothetical protein
LPLGVVWHWDLYAPVVLPGDPTQVDAVVAPGAITVAPSVPVTAPLMGVEGEAWPELPD